MSRIGINLATRPFRNNVVWWTAFSLCFAFLSAASWYNAYLFQSTGDEIEALTERLRTRQGEFEALSRETQRMTAEISKVDLASLNDQTAFANGIILSRLFSWTSLFDRLEEIIPETIRLRSVRPSISREGIEVGVDGLAREYGAIIRFEEALLDSKYFTFVYPLQETSRASEGEIQFNLAFGYVPGGKRVLEDAQPEIIPALDAPANAEALVPPAGTGQPSEPAFGDEEEDAGEDDAGDGEADIEDEEERRR